MTLGLAFWICMLIWVVIGGVVNRNDIMPYLSNNALLFVLLLLLGWKVFGAPLH
jgi:hypothetical protein